MYGQALSEYAEKPMKIGSIPVAVLPKLSKSTRMGENTSCGDQSAFLMCNLNLGRRPSCAEACLPAAETRLQQGKVEVCSL